MTGALWLELIKMALRYLAPALVGVIAHYIADSDQARLVEIFTSTEFAASLLASIVAFGLGLKLWLRKTRMALTAAASTSPVTIDEVKVMSKSAPPPLNTPTNEVPKLSEPKINQDIGNVSNWRGSL